MGAGDADFAAILARLATLERTVHLSVEAHGGSFAIPIFDPTFLARFPDLTATEFPRLIALARRGEQRTGAGEVAPIDRADWPRLAEQRVSQDIESLKQIVARKPATTTRTTQQRRGGVPR